MAVKVAIIYYSATGTTYRLARAVEEGATDAGADVRLRKVRELAPEGAIASNQGWAAHRLESQHIAEASLDDLAWADALIFGTPTRYGLPTAQLKQFLDSTGHQFRDCSWWPGDDHRQRQHHLLSLGCNYRRAGLRRPDSIQSGQSYGASFTSNNGALKPDETALASARFQGRRVTELAAQFVDGRKQA